MPAVRLIEGEESEPESQQSTADMFKDMLNQKKNMLLSKLTSFDSDVSTFKVQCMQIPVVTPSGIFTSLFKQFYPHNAPYTGR